MYGSLAAVLCVALACVTGLKCWAMWLAHQSKALEHKPLAELQAQLATLEAKLANGELRKLRGA